MTSTNKTRTIALLVLFLLSKPAWSDLPRITLVTGKWAPYTSSNLPDKGLFTAIVSATFKLMGKQPRYLFVPWKRAETFVRQGRAFAAFPYMITAARKRLFYFSDTVAYSTGRFFYDKRFMKHPPQFQHLSQLQGYRIGGVMGYWYERPFENAGLDLNLVVSDSQSLRLLALNRVDLVATDEIVGWELIGTLFPQQKQDFATLSRPMDRASLRLMVSRKYPGARALLKAFNRGLVQIKENGTYARILKAYGLTVSELNTVEGKNSTGTE